MLSSLFSRVLCFASPLDGCSSSRHVSSLKIEIPILLNALRTESFDSSTLIKVFFNLSETFRDLGFQFADKLTNSNEKSGTDIARQVVQALEEIFPNCAQVFREELATFSCVASCTGNLYDRFLCRSSNNSSTASHLGKMRNVIDSCSTCSSLGEEIDYDEDEEEEEEADEEEEIKSMPINPYFSPGEQYPVHHALEDLVKIVVDLHSNDNESTFASYLEQCGWRISMHTINPSNSLDDIIVSHPFLTAIPPNQMDRYIIDLHFKELFDVARPTLTYSRLFRHLRPVFIGTEDELKITIAAIGTYTMKSLESQNISIPPWRRPTYLREVYFRALDRNVTFNLKDDDKVPYLENLTELPMIPLLVPLAEPSRRDNDQIIQEFEKVVVEPSISPPLDSALTSLLTTKPVLRNSS